MNRLHHLSLSCFWLIVIGDFLTATRFLTASRIMDYHLMAMGVPWNQLTPGTQTMTLNFLRAGGLGFLVSALSLGLLLLFPAPRRESWAKWALLITTLIHSGSMAMVAVDVRSHTMAAPPFTPLVVFCLLALLGFAIYQPAQEE